MARRKRDIDLIPVDANAGQQEQPVRYISQRFVLAGLSLLIIALICSLFWSAKTKAFPRLPAGSFLGRISGVFPQNDSIPTLLYIEQDKIIGRMDVIIIRQGWRAVSIDVGTENGSLPAVAVSAAEARLRFTGDELPSGGYGGEVINLDSNSKGSWYIRPFDAARFTSNVGDSWEREVRLWVSLGSELNGVERRIREAEEAVPKQKNEIARLTQYLTEGTALKARAERKLEQSERDLLEAKKLFEERQLEAKQVASQLDISQRVTPRGRLVSLARESIERENRWIESQLASDVTSGDREFQLEFERAKKVLDLQGMIASLYNKIEILNQKEGGAENE